MSSFTLQVTTNNAIKNRLQKIKNDLNKLPEEAYKVFVKDTPIRSGNARRKTKLKNKKQIVADYGYAKRLDEGHSKQSPEGMTKPTTEFLEKRFRQIVTGR